MTKAKTNQVTKQPSDLDDKEFVGKLCAEIASGQNLKKLLRNYSGNLENKFWIKVYNDEAFARLVSRARSAGMDNLALECLDIADSSDETNYNSKKLQIWTRQWLCSKLSPRYRDKGLLDNGDTNGPTELIVRWGKPREKDIISIDSIETDTKALDA
jgi:hypothetical protein